MLVSTVDGKVVMTPDGGDDNEDTVPFSAAFARHDGQDVFIHSTAWNRLDGQLTLKPKPAHYLITFMAVCP